MTLNCSSTLSWVVLGMYWKTITEEQGHTEYEMGVTQAKQREKTLECWKGSM